MTEEQEQRLELKSLANIDPLIHAPARLSVMAYLYVVDSMDFVYLKRMTGLSSGNLSVHLSKLEEANYVKIHKSFQGKKPHTMIHLTDNGRQAFKDYKDNLQKALDSLPE